MDIYEQVIRELVDVYNLEEDTARTVLTRFVIRGHFVESDSVREIAEEAYNDWSVWD
jgi:hypothetical protein